MGKEGLGEGQKGIASVMRLSEAEKRERYYVRRFVNEYSVLYVHDEISKFIIEVFSD